MRELIQPINHVTLNSFRVELNAPTSILKQNIDIDLKQHSEKVVNDMIDKAYQKVCDFIQESEPNAPREYIEEFVKIFIELELENEYDIRTKSYNVVVCPRWRSVDEIDFDAVDRLPFPDW